jgi:DNA-directed RNA polymerase subunit RPC12/RpoP
MQQNQVNDDKVRCPNCNSEQVQIGKKGFDNKKGICGFFLCGPLGLFFGQKDADLTQRTCVRCGHVW